jgi:GTP-binding protein HflX
MTGEGAGLLFQALAEIFSVHRIRMRCHLRPEQSDIRAKLYAYATIIEEQIDDDGQTVMIIEIDPKYSGFLESVRKGLLSA